MRWACIVCEGQVICVLWEKMEDHKHRKSHWKQKGTEASPMDLESWENTNFSVVKLECQWEGKLLLGRNVWEKKKKTFFFKGCMPLYENACKMTLGKPPNSQESKMYIFFYLNKSNNPNFYWTQLIIQLNRKCCYKKSFQRLINTEIFSEMSILIVFVLIELN